MSRRDFLRLTTCGLLGLAFAGSIAPQERIPLLEADEQPRQGEAPDPLRLTTCLLCFGLLPAAELDVDMARAKIVPVRPGALPHRGRLRADGSGIYDLEAFSIGIKEDTRAREP